MSLQVVVSMSAKGIRWRMGVAALVAGLVLNPSSYAQPAPSARHESSPASIPTPPQLVEPAPDEIVEPTPPAEGNNRNDSDEAVVHRLITLEQQFHALVDKNLDPTVDAAALLTIGLSDAEAESEGSRWFASLIWGRLGSRESPGQVPQPTTDGSTEERTDGDTTGGPIADLAEPPTQAPVEPQPPLSDLEQARESLRRARSRFFSLSVAEQQTLIRAHEARQTEYAAHAEKKAALLKRMDEVKATTGELRAFVRGDLPVDRDPAQLFLVQLDHPIAVAAFREVFADPGLDVVPSQPSDPATGADDEQAVGAEVEPGESADADAEGLADAHETDAGADAETDAGGSDTAGGSDSDANAHSSSGDAGTNPPDGQPAAPRWTAEERMLFDAEKARAEALYDYLRRPETERKALVSTHQQRRVAANEEARKALASQQAKAETDASARRAMDAAKASEQQASKAEQAAMEAAAAKELALAAAALAADEARRKAEEERARLLGVQEQMSLFEAELLNSETKMHERDAEVLEWISKVKTVRDGIEVGDTSAAGADALWDDLIHALDEERTAFGDILSRITTGDSEVPDVSGGIDLLELAESERAGLQSLREFLRNEQARLRGVETKVEWQTADAMLANVLTLNKLRQDLIPLLSSRKKSVVSGFGTSGIAQVRGAINQGYLLVKYRIISFPRMVDSAIVRFQEAPLGALQALFEVMLIVLLFRWWRKRGENWIVSARDRLMQTKTQTVVHRTTATFLWYWRRVRAPAEWLIAGSILLWVVPSAGLLPEVEILWLVLRWVLVGFVIIRFVDAVAARFDQMTPGESTTSALRYQSLRLVGQTIVTIGLLLSLTSATVGRGVIYAWMAKMVWLLAGPVAFVLIYRWRTPIRDRIQGRAVQTPFTQWVLTNATGGVGIASTTAGGVFLLVEGIYRWLQSQLSGFAVSRRVHAYLFRREVTKQAKQLSLSEKLQPLKPHEVAVLNATSDDSPILPNVYRDDIDRARAVLGKHRRGAIAVIGERGSGKTTFLTRLWEGYPASEIRSFECPSTGYSALRGEMAASAGVHMDADDATLVAALANQGVRVVILDDIQRLIRPMIGGLRDLDRLRHLTQSTEHAIYWAFGIGLYAWQFIHRARGDRPLFDAVIRLAPWTEADIAALLTERTSAAGVEPQFDDLVAQSVATSSAAALGVLERARQGYIRILWDYSDGNPEIALHFWIESLYRRQNEEGVQVRLCDFPSEKAIESLPVSVHFVLRTLLQVEVAHRQDILASSLLNDEELADALRHCINHGIVEHVGDAVRVTRRWYRATSLVLRRQHLLMS